MRVLVATVAAGGGHLGAAAALDEAWRALRPEDTVERVDLARFFSPLHKKIYAEGYVKIVERAPELWGMMFKTTDTPRLAQRLNRLKRAFPSNSRAKFTRYLKEFKPDAVLCTHYLPLETLGCKLSKSRGKSAARADVAADVSRRILSSQRSAPSNVGGYLFGGLVASVWTDFDAHALWMDGCVDLYCVAAEETKARLVARGARAED